MYCAIKGMKHSELNEEQIKAYTDMIGAYMIKKKAQPTQVMSKKEEEKFVEWPKILEVVDKIKDDVSDYITHTNYVIVCLYTMFPPRRLEYGDMKVVQKLPKDFLLDELVDNLFVVESSEFIFGNYKTKKSYGVQQFKLPESLAGVLKDYIKKWNPEYLLTNADKGPMGEHTLGVRIGRIFERYTKKTVGVSVLRHSYITFLRKDEKPLDEQKDMASKMGHSVMMSMEYRKMKNE